MVRLNERFPVPLRALRLRLAQREGSPRFFQGPVHLGRCLVPAQRRRYGNNGCRRQDVPDRMGLQKCCGAAPRAAAAADHSEQPAGCHETECPPAIGRTATAKHDHGDDESKSRVHHPPSAK